MTKDVLKFLVNLSFPKKIFGVSQECSKVEAQGLKTTDIVVTKCCHTVIEKSTQETRFMGRNNDKYLRLKKHSKPLKKQTNLWQFFCHPLY